MEQVIFSVTQNTRRPQYRTGAKRTLESREDRDATGASTNLLPHGCTGKTMNTNADPVDFATSWEAWHRNHERQRARPLGFLSITGLHWLNREPQRFDDVPGNWSVDAEGVRVSLNETEELVVDGERIEHEYHFSDVDARGQRANFDDAIVEVALRDGDFMIRPRHPDHVVRTRYDGTPTFPPSTDWVAQATFVPYHPPRSITVGASVEGLEHVYESPGEVTFDLAGLSHRLVAFNEEDPDELFIVFTDQTAGTSTYAACRFLVARAPMAGGDVVLDFNRATNPPCAYTDFATCPLPPPENYLPVEIEAGEKSPLPSR
jgi:uncharacterized protein